MLTEKLARVSYCPPAHSAGAAAPPDGPTGWARVVDQAGRSDGAGDRGQQEPQARVPGGRRAGSKGPTRSSPAARPNRTTPARQRRPRPSSGWSCVLVLRGQEPSQTHGNLLLDRLLGAEVVWAGTGR